jgi:hypothetical protein
VFHSPGVVSGFQDFTMMREPVGHGGSHFFVAEDIGFSLTVDERF